MARIGRELLERNVNGRHVPGRFVAAAAIVRHLLTEPGAYPTNCCPTTGRVVPCGRLTRTCRGLVARRDGVELMGGNMTSGGVRVERSGPVTTVIMIARARNAVNGPAAAGLYEAFAIRQG